MIKSATVRSRSIAAYDRLDAHYFTSPGVAAAERLAMLEIVGTKTIRIGDVATVWDPPRFTRAYAAPAEPGLPYVRPYDVFDYLPVAFDRLSIARNDDLERLVPPRGVLLQTCSGRNLGPVTISDEHLATFALSHDMIRIEVDDEQMRYYLLAFLRTPIGQALLRRGRSGSVIDHITTRDVSAIPLPLVDDALRHDVATRMAAAMVEAEAGRRQLLQVLAALEEQMPTPVRTARPALGWPQPSTALAERLDAAYYDPLVQAAHSQIRDAGGVRCGELAEAFLPVRYKRYYVESDHGRPILSGRQLLQLDPVNLRSVSDRSFRSPEEYEVQTGTTVFGAVGRSEGRQGIPALVTAERNGWLASNDVMRLRPRPGVAPGAVWLAVAARQSRLQINALSFGSVIDHMNPWDVEAIHVPVVPADLAAAAEAGWAAFSRAAQAATSVVAALNEAVA